MEEEERTFTPGQAEAMDALLSGRNVFLSGNAGTGKSYVLNAFIEELEEREVPYLAMAPTGIAAQNLHNGTTIHRTLQVSFGVLDPHDENKKTLTRKVLNKAEVIIIDEVSMCRIDLFERVMNMVLAAKRVSGRKQVVLVGDFFQLRALRRPFQGVRRGYALCRPVALHDLRRPHRLAEDRAPAPLCQRVGHRVLRLPRRQGRGGTRAVARRPVRCGCSYGTFAYTHEQGGAN